jgi:hypothetical protein
MCTNYETLKRWVLTRVIHAYSAEKGDKVTCAAEGKSSKKLGFKQT